MDEWIRHRSFVLIVRADSPWFNPGAEVFFSNLYSMEKQESTINICLSINIPTFSFYEIGK